MGKIVKDILTKSELEIIHELKNGIMWSSNNTEAFYYQRSIGQIIERAKKRYFNSNSVSVMDTSKLLLEIKKLEGEELVAFHEAYMKLIEEKLEKCKGYPVG